MTPLRFFAFTPARDLGRVGGLVRLWRKPLLGSEGRAGWRGVGGSVLLLGVAGVGPCWGGEAGVGAGNGWSRWYRGSGA